MITLGRVSSGMVVVAVAAMMLLASFWPDLMHIGPVHVVDYLGLVIFVGAPVTWISAIIHWARHFPSDGPRARWGVITVVGLVPGAIAYWFWGVGRVRG